MAFMNDSVPGTRVLTVKQIIGMGIVSIRDIALGILLTQSKHDLLVSVLLPTTTPQLATQIYCRHRD